MDPISAVNLNMQHHLSYFWDDFVPEEQLLQYCSEKHLANVVVLALKTLQWTIKISYTTQIQDF